MVRFVRKRTMPSEERRSARRRWAKRLREEVIQHYGSRCVCCGTRRIEFLLMRPAQGNELAHAMKKIKTTLPWWLKKHGYPKGYRVLCYNCDMSIKLYGYCPHKSGAVL